jgi:hypothetical protein
VIEIPTIIGAGLIIPSALLIAYHELNKEKRSARKESIELAAEANFSESN